MRLNDMNRWGPLRRDGTISTRGSGRKEYISYLSGKIIEAIPITLHNIDLPVSNPLLEVSEYSSNSSHHYTTLISSMSISALFPVSPIFAALIFFFSALIAQKHLQHC